MSVLSNSPVLLYGPWLNLNVHVRYELLMCVAGCDVTELTADPLLHSLPFNSDSGHEHNQTCPGMPISIYLIGMTRLCARLLHTPLGGSASDYKSAGF